MFCRLNSAFFLPMVLLLCAGLLAAGMAWIQFAHQTAQRQGLRGEVEHMDHLLRAQVPAARDFLRHSLRRPGAATSQRPHPQTGARQTFLAISNEAPASPLYSRGSDPQPACIRMASPFGSPLHAEALPLETTSSNSSVLYFAAEDIALAAPDAPAPSWYPLPQYNDLPLPRGDQPPDPAAELSAPAPDSVPAAPADAPVPFLPGNSPPITPVVLSAALRFSIFAAGPVHHSEKPIRIRYHMEVHLWNPYDRPMRLHTGSGAKPFARLLVHDLPDVRVENVSTGNRTGWLSPDAAPNSSTGRTGLSAWLEAPSLLSPGDSLRLVGPDPAIQPEGLARSLHPAFRIGPADTIRLRFRPRAAAPSFTMLPFNTANPPEAAARGEGWFCARDLSAPAFPESEWIRADEGPAPFFLHGGSLAYQAGKALFLLRLQAAEPVRSFRTDPRKARIHASGPWQRPDGSAGSANEWYAVHCIDLRDSPEPDTLPAPAGDLFSYPQSAQPEPLLHLSLPENPDSFLLGSPGAPRWNGFLNQPSFLAALRGSANTPVVPLRLKGQSLTGLRVFPVNRNLPAAWANLLRLPPPQRQSTATHLAGRLRHNPVPHVAAFFNRGLLPDSVIGHPSSGGDPRHPFRPLQDWLTRGPVLAGHGPAWLLHLAVISHTGTRQLRRSARIWLHKIPRQGEDTPRLRLIRFQWTDPSRHLLPAPRLPGT